MQINDGFTSMRSEALKNGWTEADLDAVNEQIKKDLSTAGFMLMRACEYCGGPDHAIGMCRAVAAVEYRNGDVVKRVEFNRDAAFMQEAAEVEWHNATVGAMGEEARSAKAAGPSRR